MMSGKQKNGLDLRSERGASIAEFVILAPLIMLVTYLIYDSNRRAEDETTLSIINRNAVFLGSLPNRADELENINQKLATEAFKKHFFDDQDREQIERDLLAPQSSPLSKAYGITVDMRERVALDDSDRGLWKGNSQMSPEGVGSKIYFGASDALGLGLDVAHVPLSAAHDFFDLVIGSDPNSVYRRSTFETRLGGENNMFSKSIVTLSDVIYGEKTAMLDRRHSQRNYALSMDGYHRDDYSRASAVGAGLGLIAYPNWGGYSGFSPTSDHLQSRCMSRMSMEDSCEKENSPGRPFLARVAVIATARAYLSLALKGVPFGIGVAIDIAIAEVGNKIIEKVADGVIDTFAEKATSFIKDQIKDKLPHLDSLNKLDPSVSMKDFGDQYLQKNDMFNFMPKDDSP